MQRNEYYNLYKTISNFKYYFAIIIIAFIQFSIPYYKTYQHIKSIRCLLQSYYQIKHQEQSINRTGSFNNINLMPSLSKYDKKSKANVFHIRIGNNIDKIDIKDPAFLKILQQEYATKYLESLGVQSTAKNIYKILKEYPIENCQILESRLNGGLYTDTITIIPKTSAMNNENKTNEKQQVSSEMIQMLDLKRMGEKKYQGHKTKNDSNQLGRQSDNGQNQQNAGGAYLDSKKSNSISGIFRVKNTKTSSNVFSIEKTVSGIDKSTVNMLNNYDEIGFSKLKSQKPETQIEGKAEGLEFLSFKIEDIKSRYIFPFNDNFKRKANYKIQDSSNLIQPQDPKIVYQWNVFRFPFTKVKLSLATLKQLQNPIDAKMTDIASFLDSFYQEFPNQIFPQAPDPPKPSLNAVTPSSNFNTALNGPQINIMNPKTPSNNPASMKSKAPNKAFQSFPDKNQQTTMVFTKQQIDMMFSNIRSQSMVKMIGVFLHLAYWCIFGGVNPIQIQSTMKKKMYIMMFQTIEYFKIKVQNKKLWAVLVFPMILLTLKMAAHYFFSIQYTKIFQSQDSNKLGIDELALDKIMYLMEKMFDQSNINGRFIFLQSQITGGKGTFLKDKEYIRNRIFGTSPGLHIILPNPKNGRARAIMAKNLNKDKLGSQQSQYGKISRIRLNQEPSNDGKQCQQKLLLLALHKINNRLEEIQGHSGEVNPIINIKL